MYCLLCHEKIPRLRAWRTKSEFCSDEHAAQYKKQTLDRLLTDQNPARKETPSPIALAEEEQDPFQHDEMAAGSELEQESAPRQLPEPETPAVFSEAQAAEMESFDLPGEDDDLDSDSQDGVEELWRMAEQVEHSGTHSDSVDNDDDLPDAPRQSAEEALQALRMLASKGSRKQADIKADEKPKAPDNSAEDEFAFSDIDDLQPIGDDLMAELESGYSLLDEIEADARADAARDDERTKPEPREKSPANENEPPSILERLMEDPVTDWRPSASADKPADSFPEPSQDLPDALADFDELPEPEFAFQDDSIEAKASETEDEPEAVEETAEVEEPKVIEALESKDVEAVAEDDLEDIEVILSDDHDDPEIDPLAELIKAEKAAKANDELEEPDDLDDLEFDEAVADQLVNELAEEAFRDNIDLQELERSLKVVPFPTPDREPSRNGHHSNASEILAKSGDVLDPSSNSSEGEKETSEARRKAADRAGQQKRPGRTRTKFKPSMVMAGIEPSMQGYLQGDPLESWRGRAVKSAWGDGGAPDAYGFEISPIQQMTGDDTQLRAITPERRYHAILGVPIADCQLAEAQDADPPSLDWDPQSPISAQQSPEALSTAQESWIRLGPQYKSFEDALFVSINVHDEGEQELPPSVEESRAGLQSPLAPGGLFYDAVTVEERFVEEEDWDDSVVSLGEPAEGIDLSEDFVSEQPATQSSGGRRGR